MKIDNFKRKFRQVHFSENENFEAHAVKGTFYNFTTNIQLLIEEYKFDIYIVENVRSDLLKKKKRKTLSFFLIRI